MENEKLFYITLCYVIMISNRNEGNKLFKQKKKNYSSIDWKLPLIVALLCIFGLVILYSATLSMHSTKYIKTQIIATILGILLIGVLTLMDFDLIKKLSIPLYVLGNALLVLTLIKGVGGTEWGADSWLRIGSISFQPSEFMKIILILSLALMIEKYHERINEPKVLLGLLIFAFIPVAIIGLQPDFGTAVVFVFFIVLMFYAAGLHFKYFLGALGLIILSVPVGLFLFKSHQLNRIRVFLNPESDVTGIGWQFNQGTLAVGSGRLKGRGLFHGTQTQYDFISLKENDYIFAVLAEELGFIGTLILIVLYFFLLNYLIEFAKESEDVYGRVMYIGFAAMLLFHIFENIGMVIGVMPVTGIPLPFMSYGGTFQIINLGIIGLVLSHQSQRKTYYYE